RGLDPRGHEFAHRPPLPDRFALAAAQILDGEDAHEPAILHHHQVPDPLTLHTRPRLTRSLVGSDGHEIGRHDVAQFHRSPSLAAVGISWPGPRGPGFGSRSKAATEALYARGRIMRCGFGGVKEGGPGTDRSERRSRGTLADRSPGVFYCTFQR